MNGISLLPILMPHRLRNCKPLSLETIVFRFSTISSMVTSPAFFFFGLISIFLGASFFDGDFDFPAAFLPPFLDLESFLDFGSGLTNTMVFASRKTFPERSIVLNTYFYDKDFVI